MHATIVAWKNAQMTRKMWAESVIGTDEERQAARKTHLDSMDELEMTAALEGIMFRTVRA